MEDRAAPLAPCRPKRHKQRHEVIGVRVSTFSIWATFPILHKAGAVAPSHRVGQPAAEVEGPIIGGRTFAQRCPNVAERVNGATAAEDENAIIPERCNGCTKRQAPRDLSGAGWRAARRGRPRWET
jgi:hypothetical protein